MGKNAYAARLQAQRDAREYIIKLWMGQMMFDAFSITLSDPEIMGKDTFGEKRLKKIGAAMNQRLEEIMPALTGGPEADYIRAKVDQRLQQIFPMPCPGRKGTKGGKTQGLKARKRV